MSVENKQSLVDELIEREVKYKSKLTTKAIFDLANVLKAVDKKI